SGWLRRSWKKAVASAASQPPRSPVRRSDWVSRASARVSRDASRLEPLDRGQGARRRQGARPGGHPALAPTAERLTIGFVEIEIVEDRLAARGMVQAAEIELLEGGAGLDRGECCGRRAKKKDGGAAAPALLGEMLRRLRDGEDLHLEIAGRDL